MKISAAVVSLIVCIASFASGDELNVDIKELIAAYSEQHGAKFVLDPRVHAKISVFGIDLKDVDKATLVRILRVHGYEPIESDGVIYVVPDAVAEAINERSTTPVEDR